MAFTRSLSIAKELRRLAETPAHRDYLLRNDVNSILIFVDPDEHHVEVVTEAIKALQCLAEEANKSKDSRQQMRGTLGLMDMMKTIETREGYSIECKASSMEIQRLLSEPKESIPFQATAAAYNSPGGVLNRTGLRPPTASKESVRFLGGNKKAKIITLQIKGLEDQERRQLCIDHLVKVKGVISLTFNMSLQRCTVRARAELSPEALGIAVYDTKVMEASHVMKDEDGNETILPMSGKNHDDSIDDGKLPDYLDEDVESPSKSEFAVARPNSVQGGGFGASWFGNIVNAVNKNLYW